MTMVRQNWQHYRDLYNIDRPTYRNDFALSIALGIVSGHTLEVDTMPWPLASTLPEHTIQQLDQDYYSITYNDSEGKVKTVGMRGQDFHAMGKKQLEAIIENS